MRRRHGRGRCHRDHRESHRAVDEQLARFDDLLADLVDADGDEGGEAVLVAGEAGVGKSRLVDEWIARARAAEVLVLRGWCVEHGDDMMPLAPIADILRDIATSPDLAGRPAAATVVVSGPVGGPFDTSRQADG